MRILNVLKALLRQARTFTTRRLTGESVSVRKDRPPRKTTCFEALLLLLKFQRYCVHAITQSGWLRTIVKNVAQMRPASGALHFRARHTKTAIGFGGYACLPNGRIKAGPTGAGLKLRV